MKLENHLKNLETPRDILNLIINTIKSKLDVIQLEYSFDYHSNTIIEINDSYYKRKISMMEEIHQIEIVLIYEVNRKSENLTGMFEFYYMFNNKKYNIKNFDFKNEFKNLYEKNHFTLSFIRFYKKINSK